MRVLVVDDSVFARARVTAALRERGVAPREASAFEEALRFVGQPLDAAVLDVEIADRSGIDLARVLREAAPTLRVCFLTSNPAAVSASDARALGPVFTKGVDLGPVLAWLGLLASA